MPKVARIASFFLVLCEIAFSQIREIESVEIAVDSMTCSYFEIGFESGKPYNRSGITMRNFEGKFKPESSMQEGLVVTLTCPGAFRAPNTFKLQYDSSLSYLKGIEYNFDFQQGYHIFTKLVLNDIHLLGDSLSESAIYNDSTQKHIVSFQSQDQRPDPYGYTHNYRFVDTTNPGRIMVVINYKAQSAVKKTREDLQSYLHPNPASLVCRIENAPIGARLEVVDCLGRLVNSSVAVSNINTSNLVNGVYYVILDIQNTREVLKLYVGH